MSKSVIAITTSLNASIDAHDFGLHTDAVCLIQTAFDQTAFVFGRQYAPAVIRSILRGMNFDRRAKFLSLCSVLRAGEDHGIYAEISDCEFLCGEIKTESGISFH